jgi:hypothetical protein
MSILKKYHNISQDWEGKRYLGLDLDWDYTKRQVHLSMLNYVADAIKRFHHERPRKPQDQPYPHVKPNYGAKKQYAADSDTSPLLNKADKKSSKKSRALSSITHGQWMQLCLQPLAPSRRNKQILPRTQ